MLLPLIPFFLGSCYVLAASVWARTVKKSNVRCAPSNNAVNTRPSAMGDARRTIGDKRGAQRPTMRRTRGASSSASPPREVLRAAIVCICSFVFLQIGSWKFPFMCKDSSEVRELSSVKQMRAHPHRKAYAGARTHVRACSHARVRDVAGDPTRVCASMFQEGPRAV